VKILQTIPILALYESRKKTRIKHSKIEMRKKENQKRDSSAGSSRKGQKKGGVFI